MIRHNDDAYATMLLMSQITPSREELVYPLTTAEWYALRQKVREAGLSMGDLIDLDMSGFVMNLGATEQEAYRYCVLLKRMLPLSMSLEGFAERGIEVVTVEEPAYPARVRAQMGEKAPPMLYLAGRAELFKQDAVAILGALPAKGEAEAFTRDLARRLVEAGYVILTDGMTGLARIAEDEAVACGGKVIEMMGGALAARLDEPHMARMIVERTGAACSLVHPDALNTRTHAHARNRVMYALAHAAFVVAAERERGATWDSASEALNRRRCDAVYAWDTGVYPGNRGLVVRGATAVRALTDEGFRQMTSAWRSKMAEQLSLFDRDRPLGV